MGADAGRAALVNTGNSLGIQPLRRQCPWLRLSDKRFLKRFFRERRDWALWAQALKAPVATGAQSPKPVRGASPDLIAKPTRGGPCRRFFEPITHDRKFCRTV